MEDYSNETSISITKTLDNYIGLVIDVAHEAAGGTFFFCCGDWVSLSQCQKLCPNYSHCNNIGQVMMVGADDYKDGLFEETKEW